MERNQKIPVIAVVGPTASGKTRLSVDLAKHFGGEVISADSMQIYRHMNIGTAKVTEEEKQGIPHHMIDILDPGEKFSVAEYVEMVSGIVSDIHTRGKIPVLAGGTGLYVDSLLTATAFEPLESDQSLRDELQREADTNGNEALFAKLQAVDPEIAKTLHPNNVGRVIRAMEVYLLTGIPMSEHQRRSRLQPSPYESCIIGLSYDDRQKLYDRIDLRVDLMVRDGLLEEVKSLAEKGFGQTAAQAIGYKEIMEYFRSEVSLEEAIETVKRQSRRYAKRQLTWFRRNPDINWIFPDLETDYDAVLAKAISIVNKQLLL